MNAKRQAHADGWFMLFNSLALAEDRSYEFYVWLESLRVFFFFKAEDGIRDHCVTGVQTCALPILCAARQAPGRDRARGAVMMRALRRMLGDTRRALHRARHPAPAGATARIEPLSRVFGLDRGEPIDRYYIERFLARHAALIRGDVLEVGDDRYTRRFAAEGPGESRVLRTTPDDDPATLLGDLNYPESLPEAAFDCFICTQTFNFILPLAAAAESCHRLLRPGGVLLATVAGISQISRYDQ